MDNDKKLSEGLLKADGIAPAGATESERTAFAKMLNQQSRQKRSKSAPRQNTWSIIMNSKMTKFATVAAIIIVVMIGIGVVSKSREEQQKIVHLPDENGQQVSNIPTTEVITDVKTLAVEGIGSGKTTIETELELIDEMFAAKDIEGLVGMVENGQFASKVVSANYLAKIGDQSAFTALNELSEQFKADGADSVFTMAAASITDRLEKEKQLVAMVEDKQSKNIAALISKESVLTRTRPWSEDKSLEVEKTVIFTEEDALVQVSSDSSTKHTVTANFHGETAYAADIDGDGDLDVIGAARDRKGKFTKTLTLLDISSSSVIKSRPRVSSEPISSAKSGSEPSTLSLPESTVGNTENATTVNWWENTDGIGTAWVEHTIDPDFGGTINVFPSDIDGDGDIDIIGSEYGAHDIVWWENSNADGTDWAKHPVSPVSYGNVQLVYGVDIDSDGDIDIVGATWLDGGIHWWENIEGNGTTWKKHVVDIAMDEDYSRTHSISINDMDGDGDFDIVASAGRESGVNWWENPNDKPDDDVWVRHYVVGSDGEVESIYAADIDTDGDTDIVGSIRRHGGMTWWENTNGLGTAWGKHRIDASYHAEQRVDAIDIDGDGDVDIFGASQRINAIIWWENINSSGTEWAKHIMSENFSDTSWVYASDMDIDGDLDLLGVSLDLHEIAWFENAPAAPDSK